VKSRIPLKKNGARATFIALHVLFNLWTNTNKVFCHA
jgi:hypothetical protein